MNSKDKYNKAAIRLVEDLYLINSVSNQNNELILSLSPRFEQAHCKKNLVDRLKLAGYKYQLHQEDFTLTLTLDPKATFKIPRINIILFFTTLLSVYIVPILTVELFKINFELLFAISPKDGFLGKLIDSILTGLSQAFDLTITELAGGAGLVFTIAIISILFVHEMGHYIASRRRNIITSYPYFIPAPNIIGTFGAVIKSKSPFWNRRDLIEVGAAGPIAGWVVAMIWLIIGLAHAETIPVEEFLAEEFTMGLGPSLITYFLTELLVGEVLPDQVLTLSEAAFAGWVGLLVTAINMLPIGMLDGGHITYGLMRKKQKYVGYAAFTMLLFLGTLSPMWWIFALFGAAFGIKHPPTVEDSKPPTKTAVILGWIAIFILIISFTPIPIS